MASSLLSTDFLISETVDPIVFTAVAVVGGLWLLNKLLSTNPKMKAEAKPYGKLDADGVLWAADSVGELQTTPVEGISTIYDLVQYGVSKNGPREALGKRPLLERHYEEIAPGKEVEKLTYSNTYEWITYQEFGATIASLGAGLVDLGKLKVSSPHPL